MKQRTFSRILSLFLAVVMLASTMVLTATTATAATVPAGAEVWDGQTVSTSLERDGENYLINSAADFVYFLQTAAANASASDVFVLTDDIYFSSSNSVNFSSEAGVNFAGALNGNGHTVWNLAGDNGSKAAYVFGTVSGSIENVIFKGLTLESSSDCAFIRRLEGSVENVDFTEMSLTGANVAPIGTLTGSVINSTASGTVHVVDATVAAGANAVAASYTLVRSSDLALASAETVDTKYTISNYDKGTQYAQNEVHVLDEYVTVTTTDCHFTTELRMYNSGRNSEVIIKSTRIITSIVLNAGNKADTINVLGSTDGATWTEVGSVATSTSYKDLTVAVPESAGYTYLKLDVAGTQQVRLKYFTLTTYAAVGGGEGGEGGEDTPVEYSIGYELGGGVNAASNPSSYTSESADIVLAEPTRSGYVFLGWTYDGQTTPVKEVTIVSGSTGNKVFTANWEAESSGGEGGDSANNFFDVDTMATSSSYSTPSSTNGWTGTNAAVNATFGDGGKAIVLNGKRTAKGTLTSPTLSGGIKSLTFSYGLPNSESNGVDLQISIQQGGSVVATQQLDDNSIAGSGGKGTYTWNLDAPVSGDFVIVITNNSPSNSTSNKDRTAIWGLTWVSNSSSEGGDTPVIEVYTIEYVLNGGTNASSNPASYTSSAMDIVLAAPTRKNYIFLGWTYGDVNVPTTEVTIPSGSTGNLTFTAHWEEIPFNPVYSEADTFYMFAVSDGVIYYFNGVVEGGVGGATADRAEAVELHIELGDHCYHLYSVDGDSVKTYYGISGSESKNFVSSSSPIELVYHEETGALSLDGSRTFSFYAANGEFRTYSVSYSAPKGILLAKAEYAAGGMIGTVDGANATVSGILTDVSITVSSENAQYVGGIVGNVVAQGVDINFSGAYGNVELAGVSCEGAFIGAVVGSASNGSAQYVISASASYPMFGSFEGGAYAYCAGAGILAGAGQYEEENCFEEADLTEPEILTALNEADASTHFYLSQKYGAPAPVSFLKISQATVMIGDSVAVVFQVTGINNIHANQTLTIKDSEGNAVDLDKVSDGVYQATFSGIKLSEIAEGNTYTVCYGDFEACRDTSISVVELLAGIYGISSAEEQAVIEAMLTYAYVAGNSTVFDTFNAQAGTSLACADLSGINEIADAQGEVISGSSLDLSDGFVIVTDSGNTRVSILKAETQINIGGVHTSVAVMLNAYLGQAETHDLAAAAINYYNAVVAAKAAQSAQ